MSDTLTEPRELLDQQRFEEALLRLEQARPVTPQVKILRGRALSGLSRWQEAHTYFCQALDEDPHAHEGWAGKGLIHYLAGQLPEAKHDYDKAVENGPMVGRYRGLRGVLLAQAGDAVNALKDLQAAYDLGDTDPTYLLTRAQLHLAMSQVEPARAAIQLAEIHQADQGVLSALEGALSMLTGNPQEALASYRFAVEAAPGMVESWLNMLTLTAQLERSRLFDEVKRALKAHPDQDEIIQLAVGAYMEKGLAKEAFQILRDAIERQPENPLLHFQLGLGLANTKKYQKAVEALTCALELQPRFPRALDARGNCLERLERAEEAKKDFEESHRIRTEDAQRLAALQQAAEERRAAASAAAQAAQAQVEATEVSQS